MFFVQLQLILLRPNSLLHNSGSKLPSTSNGYSVAILFLASLV